MRVVVLGATGGTGTEVVRQAIGAGHELVPVVRDPNRLHVPGARAFQANVTDPDALVPAMRGADAVISALGPRRGEPPGVLAEGARATLAAMTKAGVRRLIVVSASGFFAEDGDGLVARAVVKPLLQRLLSGTAADTRQMEELVTASDAEWTIMRPPRLTNGQRRGRYRTAIDRYAGSSISRADLADAILVALADPATIGHRVGVAY